MYEYRPFAIPVPFRVASLFPRSGRNGGPDVIRLLSFEVVLFLAPFIGYALFLWATREGFLHPAQWSVRAMATVTLVAMVLTGIGFVAVAQFSGYPAHSDYIPAHVENGRVVPGVRK
jgi:hypothetical protein